MSDSPEELLSRVAAMKKQLKNFRILGADGVTIHGSMQHGYAVDTDGGGGGGGGGGSGTPTGACCVGATCITASAADCSAAAGIYQGDATPCSPNPCAPTTGACCFDDFCELDTESDCLGLGGEFKGIGTTCGDPSICPVGSCCIDISCFENNSQLNCEGDGGVYNGDGSTCDPNPCNCPLINLTCDSISASGSKCGYADESDPPHYWLRRDFNITNEDYNTTACGYFTDGACVDISGLGPGGPFNSAIYTAVVIAATTEKDYQEWDPVTCEEQAVVYKPELLYYTDCHYFNDHSCSDSNYGPYECGGGTAHCGACDTTYFFCVTTYSNEYTTAMLISNVEDALPAYSGEYTGGACASSRFLSTDEATYSIQRSKPKFGFTAAPVDFLLCYNEHFVPAGAGSPSDTPKCIAVSIGETEAFGDEMFEPSANGTTTVEDITCTPV